MSNPTLRNMTAIYLLQNDKILLLYRKGSKVSNNKWIGAAGGHFKEYEINDATACVLREMQEEISVTTDMIENLKMRYLLFDDKVIVERIQRHPMALWKCR